MTTIRVLQIPSADKNFYRYTDKDGVLLPPQEQVKKRDAFRQGKIALTVTFAAGIYCLAVGMWYDYDICNTCTDTQACFVQRDFNLTNPDLRNITVPYFA